MTTVEADEIAALTELVSGPITPDVERALDGALGKRPHDLRLRLLRAEAWRKTGQTGRAVSLLRHLRQAHPKNPWISLRLVRALLAQSEPEAAADILAADVWRSEIPEEQRGRALSEVVAAIRDPAARRGFLTKLLSGGEKDRFVLVKLGSLAYRAGDRAEAARLFDQAAALGPLPLESGPLHLELLMISGRADEALEAAIGILKVRPDRRDVVRRAILAARLCRRTDTLITLLRRALEQWPEDWLLVFRYNRAACPLEIDRALFAHLSAHADAVRADDRWTFQFALACLRHEQTGRALEILRRLGPESPVAHMAGPLLLALSSRPDDAWSNPRLISNDPAEDVQLRAVDGAKATLIVLAGVQGSLGYLPYSHADVLLAPFSANVIYLRDRNELGFTAGVASLGPDEAATIAALKEMAASLGGAPVVTLGASLGGASAVRLGCLMGAKAAISFAGPLQWTAEGAEDEDGDVLRSRLRNAIFANFTQAESSIVELIAQSPATVVHHCYGEDCEGDSRNARRLAPLPNARLEAEPGCADHSVIDHMIASGSFDRLLTRLIEG
jgi:tetratricopeptide (TPR) repeat protein